MALFWQHTCLLIALLYASSLSAGNAVAGRMESDPVFGGEFYLVESGDRSRETLVLVHGLGPSGSDDWTNTIAALRGRYHILALDLPGFGRSDKGNKSYSPTRYAALIRYATSRYANTPFHLVGHSMGGAVALRYAASYPEDVSTLTLVDAAGILHRLAYTKFLAPLGLDMLAGGQVSTGRSTVSGWAGALLGAVERNIPLDLHHIQSNSYLRERVLRGNPTTIAGFGLVMEDFSRAPGRVTAPTLIIWGAKDQVAPLRTGHVLNALIPKSHLEIIDNAAHVPMRDAPADYLGYLEDHLRGRTDSSAGRDIPPAGDYREKAVCEGDSGQRYTGRIGRLYLKECTQVRVENAKIDRLTALSSQVDILNSEIGNAGIALVALDSSISVTAGKIHGGKVAIHASGGRFDIAGTRLSGREAAVRARLPADFVFSLVPIESPLRQEDMIHGQYRVTSKEPL